MKKKLMIIGANWEKVPLIQKAKKLGHFVFVTDESESAEGFKYADKFQVVNPRDLKKLLDLAKQFNGNLSDAFKLTKAKFFIISFTSDWLYPTQENKDIVIALNSIGADVGFVEIESDKGHDSFLLDVPDFLNALKNFLDKSYEEN